MELSERILDKFGGVADRSVWHQVEVKCYAGELIQMIHSLRADNFLCRCYNTHRHEIRHVTSSRSYSSSAATAGTEVSTGVAANVQIIEIVRMSAFFVFNLEDNLVLIVRLFDEIDVI